MTPFTDIYSLAKVTIIDYKIDMLINADYEAFLTYFRSLLTVGISEFSGCLKSLEYQAIEEPSGEVDENKDPIMVTNWYFSEDLDIYEKYVKKSISRRFTIK